MRKFWAMSETNNVLYIEGEIASESWFGDEVTPKAFRQDLNKLKGDITVCISSPGGDVIAASEIYTALKEHNGHVTVLIEGIAASAASVIAMAGDTVKMSPTAYMMIHRASTMAWGNVDDMDETARMLREIDDGIILAYQTRSHLTRDELLDLMTKETWLNAKSALDYGLIDEIAFQAEKAAEKEMVRDVSACTHGVVYAAASRYALYDRVLAAQKKPEKKPDEEAPARADGGDRARLKLELTLMGD